MSRRWTYIVSVARSVVCSIVVTVIVLVTGAILVVTSFVVVDGIVVVTRHVGRGSGYLDVQND
jgi:hypothetical protein